MPEVGAFSYIRLHPSILQPGTSPPFDAYVRRSEGEGFTPFKTAGQAVYANTQETLHEAGVDVLYVPDEHAESCFDYVEEHLPAILHEGALPTRQSAEWIYRLACRAMAALLEQPYSTPAYSRVRDLMSAAVDTIQRNPGAEWHMMDCAPLTYYTHSHCINVAILLASSASRILGVKEKGLLTQVLLGGALHDLGKALVPTEILQKPAPLTPDEFRQIEKHPVDGVKIARAYLRQAPVAKCIIQQHHEDVCGGGYPDGRSDGGINLFARAARVVDVFDALTSHRPYRSAMDSDSAISTMLGEMRDQFDHDILRRFINHLPSRFAVETPTVVTTQPRSKRGGGQAWRDNVHRSLMRGPGDAATEVAGPVAAPTERRAYTPTAPARSEQPPAGATVVHDEPTPEEKLAAIEELGTARRDNVTQMRGIMTALGEAFGDKRQGAVNGPSDEGPEEDQQDRPPAQRALADQTELKLVQSLLAILWELDAWHDRFSAQQAEQVDSDSLRAEILTCLRSLRETVANTLRDHKIQVLDDTGTTGCRRH